MEKKYVFKLIDKKLKSIGFKGKPNTWYNYADNYIKVVNLQKSSYSNSYHVNLGIYFRDLGGDEFPKEEFCHIRTRMDSDIVNSSKNYNFLFNSENLVMEPKNIEININDCIENVIVPQLELLTSKQGIEVITKTHPSFINAIPIQVKKYLKI